MHLSVFLTGLQVFRTLWLWYLGILVDTEFHYTGAVTVAHQNILHLDVFEPLLCVCFPELQMDGLISESGFKWRPCCLGCQCLGSLRDAQPFA